MFLLILSVHESVPAIEDAYPIRVTNDLTDVTYRSSVSCVLGPSHRASGAEEMLSF